MFNFKNIMGSPLTSLLGFIVILAGLYAGLTGKADWTSAGTVMALGAGLLHIQDPKSNGEAGLFALMLMATLLMIGCRSHKATLPTTEVVVVRDSTTITQDVRHDTTYLAGETMTRWLPYNCDSLGKLHINKGYQTSAKGKRSERLKVDVDTIHKSIYVQADCDSLIYINTHLVRQINSLKNHVIFQPSQAVIKEWGGLPWYVWMISGSALTIIAGLLLKRII